MGRALISWAVVGVLIYIWYWVGYEFTYLQEIPRGDWKPTWVLYTLIVLVVCKNVGSAGGANVVEAVTGRIKGIVPHLVGLTLSLFVGLVIWSLMHGGFDMNEFIQAIVVAVGAGVLTSAWVGAVEDAVKG